MANNKDQKYERVEIVNVDEKDEGDNENMSAGDCYESEWEVFAAIKDDFKLHVNTSLMHKATKQDEENFLKQIEICCTAHKDFDIYQILAFESTLYDPLNIREVWTYRIKGFKAVICSLTQITAICIILHELITAAKVGEKEKCHNVLSHNMWYMNILAFLVSVNFTFSVSGKLNLTKGLYRYVLLIDYNVKWINHSWLYYGCLINTVVSILCIWGAFFIVFFSESALSMIFSVVSIFYLQGLDDAMTTNTDYDQLKKAMKSNFKGRDKKRARYINRNCGSCQCCDIVEKIFYVLFGVPFILVKYVTYTAAVIAPIYFAICF